MKILREIRLLFKRKAIETLREPLWIVTEFSTPLLYLVLFAPLLRGLNSETLGNGEVLDMFVPGMLALFAFSTGMGEGWTVNWELQTGVTERFRVTPASRFSLLMGTVLRNICMFLVSALFVSGISLFFGFRIHVAGSLLLLVLLSLLTTMMTSVSVSMALKIKNVNSLSAILVGIQLPIMLLAGVLLPISLGPLWMQILAHFNPLYYAVEASRVLAVGTIASGVVLEAFAVMLPLTALILWWTTRVYRKAVA